MKKEPTAARDHFGKIAPAFAEITDKVLFGDVWERPGLTIKERSMITVATLIALYRQDELKYHMKRAMDNGVSRAELVEILTHLAFYAGWPCANSAINALPPE